MEGFREERPEVVGLSPHRIEEAIERCENELQYLHGMMIAKDGALVAQAFWQPFDPEVPRNGYSLGKSLVSLAIGFALDEGKVHLETKVLPLLREELPGEYDHRLEALTVQNLLTMAASSATASTEFAGIPSDQWLTHYFSLKPPAQPGTEFHYDTGGMYLLSCLISKITGKNTFLYLKEKLLLPLGITQGYWLEDGKGRNVGGWGIYLKISDELKIAQTLVDGGKWNGVQVIPAWYIKELTVSKISTENDPGLGWTYGYSYGFWKGREEIFLAFGAFGQLWICDPKRRMAVVTMGGCSHADNRKLLEILQETLFLPAIEAAIPLEEESYRTLKRHLCNLSLPYPPGEATDTALASRKTYHLQRNSKGYCEISFADIGEGALELHCRLEIQQYTIRAGYRRWITQSGPNPKDFYAFAYGWEALGQLVIVQYQLDQPTGKVYRFTFDQRQISFTETASPSLFSAEPELITGRYDEPSYKEI